MAFPRISNGFISEKIIFNEDLVLVTVNLNRKLPRIKAGQFVHLALTEYLPDKRWPESRVFSVANKTDGLSIKLLISRQGAFTSFLIDKININAKVSVKGPYGEFCNKRKRKLYCITQWWFRHFSIYSIFRGWIGGTFKF